MTPLTLLLHDGGFFFRGFFFLHPPFLWMGLLLLFIIWKRHGGHGHPGGGHRRPKPAPAPSPTQPRAGKGEGGPAWPDLYPDDPSRQPQAPLEPKGKVEYF